MLWSTRTLPRFPYRSFTHWNSFISIFPVPVCCACMSLFLVIVIEVDHCYELRWCNILSQLESCTMTFIPHLWLVKMKKINRNSPYAPRWSNTPDFKWSYFDILIATKDEDSDSGSYCNENHCKFLWLWEISDIRDADIRDTDVGKTDIKDNRTGRASRWS